MRLTLDQIRASLPALNGVGAPSLRPIGAATSDSLYPAPRITAALRFGTPQRRVFLGDALMPVFSRDTWKVLVISEGDEHLRVFDTERGFQEPRKRGKFVQSSTEFSMAAFGFEYGVDRRLATRFADQAFRLAVGAARRAQEAVRLDLENRIALMLSTPANYAAADRKDASGTPWNGAGGDGKADFLAAFARLKVNHPGYTEADFRVGMSQHAWDALRNDTTWLADRITAGEGTSVPTVADAEVYLGLQPGSITVGDASVVDGGTVQNLWGETAIIFIAVNPSTLDTTFGSDVFALLHEMGGGNAFAPYFDDRPTTDWYPFERFALPVVHDYTSAYLIHSMLA